MGTSDEIDEISLTHFLQVADETYNESLEILDVSTDFLGKIDALYEDFIEEGGGIRQKAAAVLLINAHASFRAAIRLSYSGQLLPTFMTLRGSIESALYANAILQDSALQDVWIHRNSSDEARKTCRAKFTARRMFSALAASCSQEFANSVRDAYDWTIDFGAHPNSRLVLRSTDIKELDTGEFKLSYTYIHGPGSTELRRALVACAETGLIVLFVLMMCYEEHPRLDAIHEHATALQDQLPNFIKQLGFKAVEFPT